MNRVSRFAHQAALAVLAASLVAGCAKSDDSNAAGADQPGANAPATISDSRTTNSDIAVNVLLAVQQARDALAHQDKAAAATHVNAALTSLTAIRSVPLVPIYTELSQQSFIAPIEQAKKEGGKSADLKAQAHAAANAAAARSGANDNASGAASTTNASENASATVPLVARAVTTGYTSVMLDTSVTQTQLNSARSALDRGDLKAADKSLKMVEQSVVLESSAARLPLVRARENLTLASTAASSGNWAGAQAQLNAAAKSLGNYAAVAPAADMADVKVLQQQIAAYAGTIHSQHNDAAGKINGWWTRVANLTDRRA